MAKTLLESLGHTPEELNFGTSGLRALVTDMTDLECYINTRGFLDFLLQSNEVRKGGSIALGGDLRPSTPRILQAVSQAILDSGFKVIYLGIIPIPAVAYYGVTHQIPVIMVTGSHIPADRNGIKFYRTAREVLKEDEPAIKELVGKVRGELYSQPSKHSIFKNDGSLKSSTPLPAIKNEAANDFLKRYLDLFNKRPLEHKKIVVYQHSSVAADLLVKLLEGFGAEAIPVDRSETFIPIDTENVTAENRSYFKSLSAKYPDCFAIVSADGDSDRPFVIDEGGMFHRGDVVGAVTAAFLKAKAAAVPISASDAVDVWLNGQDIKVIHTKIGSPYVVSAMEEAEKDGNIPVVGWEVNGGFLTGSEIKVGSSTLLALPTRDAFLPIVCVLMSAAQKKLKLSKLFESLPQRFTAAGLIDNFPTENSQAILNKFSEDSSKNRLELAAFFRPDEGFVGINKIDTLDGVRMIFKNGDIAHIRPSGNAPQLRIYSVADSQKR
ncbi:MAG TPA: hypothetical protein VFB03_03100, partial [Candidatus Saccharimonadales bacterium]|nr:hypothetical protein [Candidatus Saccharimonadales bacterium]